ncbi:MAG: DMT family transporter [Gammaproteobacteria bacterium]|nr:DMT family transporter [Gammaproteobacteria bacterium]
MEIVAVALALATAATWALVTQLQQKGIQAVDGRTGALIVVLSFAGLFWLLAPFFIEWQWFGTRATVIFIISGFLVPGLAQQFQMLSVEKLGATFTAIVGAFAPVFAVVPAVVILKEQLNLQAAIGIALIIVGVILSVRAKTRSAGAFSLVLIWLALGGAATRGLGQPVSKYGLNELPEPFFATLVMVTSAAVFIGVLHLFRHRETIRIEVTSKLLWLVAAGMVLGFGFLLLYAALNVGDVVFVAPFIATMPIWVVLYDHFIFKHDRIGKGQMLSAVVVTLGAVVLVTR